MRDAHKLNMAELNDVTHLIRHLNQGRNIFVTRNSKSFIDQGKREQLQSAFRISAMTPEEVVDRLSKQEGWTIPVSAPQASISGRSRET